MIAKADESETIIYSDIGECSQFYLRIIRDVLQICGYCNILFEVSTAQFV